MAEQAALFITHITAYPVGFGFRLLALTRDDPERVCRSALESSGSSSGDASLTDLHLTYEVEFSDARRADGYSTWISATGTSEQRTPVRPLLSPDPERDLILSAVSSVSQACEYRQDCWVWPLPASGSVRFRCGWLAAGILGQQVEVDAASFREAAERARPLWSRESV